MSDALQKQDVIVQMQADLKRALEKPKEQRRWVMVLDLRKCVGCHACTISCVAENKLPPGVVYRPVLEEEIGTYPNVTQRFMPRPCMQCDNPPCTPVCPVNATYKNDDGVVVVDYDQCIGCQYCAMACPYGVRYFNKDEGVVEKCTLCTHLVERGEEPACVKVCSAKARIFGDIDDPNSKVSKAIQKAGSANVHTLADVGNHPSVHYVLHRKIATWRSG